MAKQNSTFDKIRINSPFITFIKTIAKIMLTIERENFYINMFDSGMISQ